MPAGLGPARGERVRPEPLSPGGRLGRGEAVLLVCPFGAQDLIGAERVPRQLAGRRLAEDRCTRFRSHTLLSCRCR